MTDVRFDIWDKQLNALVKGNDLVVQVMHCPLNEMFKELQYRFIFLRYSGLPDISGKEIREGHVIVGPDEMTRIVTYKPGAFVAVLPGEQEGIYLSSIFQKCCIIAGEDVLPECFLMAA